MTASPFWTFSLAIYGKPGVPPACLTLQGESGVDVNVLLFGLFLASRGRALGAGDFANIDAAVEPWRRAAVVPLRQVRTFLKSPPEAFSGDAAEALRSRVKAVELEAERLQQEALYGLFGEGFGRAGEAGRETARGNVGAYAAYLGKGFDEAAVAAILRAFA